MKELKSMVDAESLPRLTEIAKCSHHIVWTPTVPSTRRRVPRAHFKDNERSTCLHYSSDEDNTRFLDRDFNKLIAHIKKRI